MKKGEFSKDAIFKFVFGREENKKYLQRFLELYLEFPLGSLNDIELLDCSTIETSEGKVSKIVVNVPSLNTIVILKEDC